MIKAYKRRNIICCEVWKTGVSTSSNHDPQNVTLGTLITSLSSIISFFFKKENNSQTYWHMLEGWKIKTASIFKFPQNTFPVITHDLRFTIWIFVGKIQKHWKKIRPFIWKTWHFIFFVHFDRGGLIAYLFIIYSHSTVLPPTLPAPPWIVNCSIKMILPAVPKMELNGIQA